MFYFLLIAGVIVRLMLVPVAGFKADVAFWKGWGLAVADKGILWLVGNTNYNYPPGFTYVLWMINKIYALFANPYKIDEYWADNNLLYLFLIKLIVIGADLLIVYLIVKIGSLLIWAKHEISTSQEKSNKSSFKIRKYEIGVFQIPKILALCYFLNPAVIYNGVVWGQVDQFGLAVFLLSLYLLIRNRYLLATVVFTLGCLLKFQNIIFIPLFFLFILKQCSWERLVKSVSISFLTFMIIVLPFILGRQVENLIRLLTINSDWFPWYSLNAFNIWWILSGLKGMQVSDKHLFLGLVTAKQLGLLMFSFSYLIAVFNLLLSKKDKLMKSFILSSALAVFAFFHLLTQSHERYLFPLMGLFPLIIINSINQNLKAGITNQVQIYSLFIIGSLVSLFFFLNMYLSMGWNYPDQVILSFTKEQTLGLSFWIAVGQIILFAFFLFWFFGRMLIRRAVLILPAGGIVVALIVFRNNDYILKRPISLTVLKPVAWRQDYFDPIYDKTVESNRGAHFWNRLSVNYFFYKKGIGSHANSEITYHLGKKFSQFSSDFGVDTEAGADVKVYFSLIGDGRELFRSKTMGRYDYPQTITIPVDKVNYLTLKITNAASSINGAHADWLNPVLIR